MIHKCIVFAMFSSLISLALKIHQSPCFGSICKYRSNEYFIYQYFSVFQVNLLTFVFPYSDFFCLPIASLDGYCCALSYLMTQSTFPLDEGSARRKEPYSLSLVMNAFYTFNPLNAELNPICHLLPLLGTHPVLHVSRIRANV
jgi:hypothetical protein